MFELNVASPSSSPSPSEIVLTLDSGSSVNVFNELSLFSSVSESAEGIVGVGGVSVTVSLIGRSVFSPAYFLEGNPFNTVSVHQLRELGATSWISSDFSAWYVTIPDIGDFHFRLSDAGLFHCVVPLPRVQAVALAATHFTAEQKKRALQAVELHARCFHCSDDVLCSFLEEGAVLGAP
jgi:hypothetical protein